jgi:hypothetical protein
MFVLFISDVGGQRQAFKQLLQYFKVFLSVIQKRSSKTVCVERVKQYGVQMLVHFKSHFPWAVIGPSVHQICCHAWELFQMNDAKSISMWSESPIEAWHKYIRSFKSGAASRARQCSPEENIHDVFSRMIDMTHPAFWCTLKQVSCSYCNEVGHTQKSCKDKKYGPLNEEDTIIESFYEVS